MANHVNTYITIEEGNEAAEAALANIFNRIKTVEEANKGDQRWYQVNAFELWEDTQKLYDEEKYGELMDEIGSKWCHVDDCDTDFLNFCSAWSFPEGLVERIAKEVMAADPEAIISAYYDDEMPNFIGIAVYADGECHDIEEIDSDEYSSHGLKFWWDEDEEGCEEPDDFEPTYDEAHNIRDEFVQNCIEAIKEIREEDQINT